MAHRLERIARTCYKSEGKLGDTPNWEFISRLVKRGHAAMIEHSQMQVHFTVDRGVSYELVRHRIASFAQESTRYCDYGESGVTFILPPWVDSLPPGQYDIEWNDSLYGDCPKALAANMLPEASWWFWHCAIAERDYQQLSRMGWSPQQARSVLPNSTKTEIVITANWTEWRHIFKLRTAVSAHPQMREVMIPLLHEIQSMIPRIFDGIGGAE